MWLNDKDQDKISIESTCMLVAKLKGLVQKQLKWLFMKC